MMKTVDRQIRGVEMLERRGEAADFAQYGLGQEIAEFLGGDGDKYG